MLTDVRALVRKLSRNENFRLYTGTLIEDLISAVSRAEQVATSKPFPLHGPSCGQAAREALPQLAVGDSETEQFTQSLGLRPADWNLALLFVIHAQLVRTLEPGHDLANAVDIHQVGAVSPPEQTRIQAGQ